MTSTKKRSCSCFLKSSSWGCSSLVAAFRLYCHGLGLEILIHHGLVLLREDGWEEQGDQEGEADNLHPASQGLTQGRQCHSLVG